jgi:hypothetical protein
MPGRDGGRWRARWEWISLGDVGPARDREKGEEEKRRMVGSIGAKMSFQRELN